MIVDAIASVFLALVGPVLALVALAILFVGGISARKSFVALAGAETPIDALHRNGDGYPYAKLTATVVGSDAPVETIHGEEVAMYRVDVRRRNDRRLTDRRRHYKEVLVDAVAFERASIQDDAGTRCLLTARPDEDGDRWGDRQRAIGDYEHVLRQTPLLSTTWDAVATYYDDAAVPSHVVAYLADLDVDTDFELDQFGVRKLTVREDVVDVGDTVRILGRVRRRPIDDVSDDADGPDGQGAVVLRYFTTVTTDSWRAVAWDRAKTAALRLPFGVVLAAASVTATYGGLRGLGLL